MSLTLCSFTNLVEYSTQDPSSGKLQGSSVAITKLGSGDSLILLEHKN